MTKLVFLSLPGKCSTSAPQLCKPRHPDKSSLTFVSEWEAENWEMTSKTDYEMQKNRRRKEVSSIFTVRCFRYPLLPERGIENDYLEEAEYVRALEWTVGWEILTSAESDQTSYPDERKIR